MNHWHTSWLARHLEVVESSDPTLVGRRGVVLDESRNTIMIQESDKVTTLAKDVIRFTIDGSEPVVGSMVCQRPEDRVQRKYRRN